MSIEHEAELRALAARRWRVAVALTLVQLVIYFGFLVMVAFEKPLMGKLVGPGLSLGLLLGALEIVVVWILTGIYVRWANRKYDPLLHQLRHDGGLR